MSVLLCVKFNLVLSWKEELFCKHTLRTQCSVLLCILGAIKTSLRASDLSTIRSTGIRSIRSDDSFPGNPIYNWKNGKIDRQTHFCTSVVSFLPIIVCKIAKIGHATYFLVFKMAKLVMRSIFKVSKWPKLVVRSIFSIFPNVDRMAIKGVN